MFLELVTAADDDDDEDDADLDDFSLYESRSFELVAPLLAPLPCLLSLCSFEEPLVEPEPPPAPPDDDDDDDLLDPFALPTPVPMPEEELAVVDD